MSSRDPRINPRTGDRLKMSYGEEYEVVRVTDSEVTDISTKGMDAGDAGEG